ncbi:spore coat protein H [Entomortierella parvispora]|uniref:Spore coat protein H n=1 Tax=Entomortierella parvispora TaxID=205924 RepID=A0A9P3HDV8_9FUNG|nr:spore coat protein H [Entomortierella parvispora]
MVRLILGLAACAATAMADVTFNVVGLREKDSDEFGVLINGRLTKLTTSKTAYPLWSAKVTSAEAPLKYTFVRLEASGKVKKEKEARQLPEGASHTPNDFFDRPNTLHALPPFPQVYKNKLQQNSPFFREGYIGNIFVEGDPANINFINTGGGDFYPKPIKVKIQYIGANENVRINDVIFNLSGKSAREYAKLAYQFKFPKKNRLLGLSTLKLRNEETDATLMREKLYVDMLNSLGVPAQQAAYVRLFFNGKPIGLFVGMDEMKKHWIKKVLHPRSKKAKLGALWKMNSCCGHEGNLQWLGPTSKSYVIGDIYKNVLLGANPKDDPMRDLIKFMADLKNYNPKKVKDPIAYWEERLDLEVFLKSMAMEYLTGSWDSYWLSGSNYQFYNNPVTGKWTWLPTDFDDTFGTSFEGKIESYKNIPKINENGFESPLAQKLIIETPEMNKRFEEILKDTVNYIFKIDAVTPRLEAYKKMIEQDVAWDRSLPRVALKGKNKKFTIQDLSKGMDKGVQMDWGLRNWIEKRSAQVQNDLGFKAVSGDPTKIEHHVVTELGSPYGLVAQQGVKGTSGDKSSTISKSGVSKSSNSGASESSSSGSVAEKVDVSAATSAKSDKSENSAMVLKGNWAALSAMLAMVVLVL